MSETETSADPETVTEGAFDLTVRQRLYVFLVVDLLVVLIVLWIAFF